MGHKKLKGIFQMKNSDIFLISTKKTYILKGNKKYTVSGFEYRLVLYFFR